MICKSQDSESMSKIKIQVMKALVENRITDPDNYDRLKITVDALLDFHKTSLLCGLKL